ncbi:MAG: hypothetical protein IRZ07_20205 [Microbispora sp.]|nr:hypothetical protein [Microbispora sp.]
MAEEKALPPLPGIPAGTEPPDVAPLVALALPLRGGPIRPVVGLLR